MNLPVSVTQNELMEVLLNIAPVRPVFIWGAPRIGKSSIVEQFAEEIGLPCVSLLGSQLAPEDIIGIPRINGETSEFLPPKMIARKEPYVLFLDELNACSQEVQEAFEWYKRAAAHGNPTGMYIVGFMLEYGQGVSQDYEQALKYYLQAANLGDEDAMYRAGMIYANLDGEYGNTSIPEEAEYWLSLALRFTDDQELTDSISKILPYVTLG